MFSLFVRFQLWWLSVFFSFQGSRISLRVDWVTLGPSRHKSVGLTSCQMRTLLGSSLGAPYFSVYNKTC